MTASKPEVLPCPFCGAEPLEHAIEPHSHGSELKALGVPDHPGSHFIECGCGAGMIAEAKQAVRDMWNRREAFTYQEARIAELEEKLSRCKRELTRLNQVLHDRNIALDALHYVWCNGGCQTGMHRFGDGVLTEEILLQAEVSVKRMRIWFDNKRSRDKNHAQRMSALAQQGKEGEA